MWKKYCITNNAQKEPLFLIQTKEGIIKFKENKDGI